jgi:DNA-binding transcriptional ArsR family regulator
MTLHKTTRSRTDLILHPVRLRLMTELTGRSLTSKQLAEALPDLPQASLYRHIKLLVEGGIFETVAEQLVNGATERTYAVAQGQGRLTGEELSGMTATEHREAFQLFVASLTERFSRYIDHADLDLLEDDGLSYNGTVIYLSDQEKAALRDRMMALIAEFASLGPSENRRRYTLGSIVIPDERRHS